MRWKTRRMYFSSHHSPHDGQTTYIPLEFVSEESIIIMYFSLILARVWALERAKSTSQFKSLETGRLTNLASVALPPCSWRNSKKSMGTSPCAYSDCPDHPQREWVHWRILFPFGTIMIQTRSHILADCPDNEDILTSTSQDLSLPILLGTFKGLSALARFVAASNAFRKTCPCPVSLLFLIALPPLLLLLFYSTLHSLLPVPPLAVMKPTQPAH